MAAHYDTVLYYCFELPGVMKELSDPDSLIKHITEESYTNLLVNNVISAGMLPKLYNAFDALKGGLQEVGIGSTKMICNNTPYTSITLKWKP